MAYEWNLAVDAGMRYMLVRSKYYDVFAMHISKMNVNNNWDASPYQENIVQGLCDA